MGNVELKRKLGTWSHGAHEGRRGTGAVIAVMVIVLLAILSGAMLMTTLRGKGERTASIRQHQATYTADAGISLAITNLTAGDDTEWIGTELDPLEFAGGEFWTHVEDNGDATYRVTSSGLARGELQVVEAVLEPTGGGIYDNAVFAGNTDNDPLYTLEMGGSGGEADLILGDIFSGGDVDIVEDATVTGVPRAEGEVHGANGEEGVTQPIPDLAGMNYSATAEVNVSDMFSGPDAYLASDGFGGTAWQMPEESAAHIFRLNPSDRAANTSSTPGPDYFIEDPYEQVRVDRGQDGSDASAITLSGTGDEPGIDGNKKVYYIDGNLWLHNKKTYSFKFEHDEPNGIQVTFVVKGNIYFSDNLFYTDPDVDGVAFIAMKDDNIDDSGNIYFGDPVYGTLEQMNAFMYAENNFYDTNLDAGGSSEVYLNGNMTAGNQVLIERDWDDHHTKLTVDFDDRISVGELSMPGLPGNSGAGPDRYLVTYWRELSDHQVEIDDVLEALQGVTQQ
jgi:hypothetical protein